MEAQIGVRVSSGNPPDLAIFPQPGLLTQIVESSGAALKVPDATAANVDKWYANGVKGYGTVNDIYFGVPNSTNFKSLVWYSPKDFKAKGYEVPKTYDELIALSDKIAATGAKPWCAGIASGEATGWTATDWLEDYVLRTAGPDVYDQWVSHEVKFSDAPIANALAEMGKVLKNPDYVNGGIGDVKSIASTDFKDGGLPILKGECTFHRQATFYEANWPKGTKVGPDGDVNAFYLPGIDDAVRQARTGRRRDGRFLQGRSRGLGAPVLLHHPVLLQRSGKAGLMALGEQGPRGGLHHQRGPQGRAGGAQGSGNRDQVRRIGSDAGAGRIRRRVEAVHRLDHRSGRCNHPGQYRQGVAGELIRRG